MTPWIPWSAALLWLVSQIANVASVFLGIKSAKQQVRGWTNRSGTTRVAQPPSAVLAFSVP